MNRVTIACAAAAVLLIEPRASAKKKPALAPYPPVILGPIEEGTKKVDVRLAYQLEPGDIRLYIRSGAGSTPAAGSGAECSDSFDRVSVQPAAVGSEPGRFTLTLQRKPALEAGEQILVRAGSGQCSAAASVAKKTTAATPSPLSGNILNPVSKDDEWLSGTTDHGRADVLVNVIDADGNPRFTLNAVSNNQSAWALRLPDKLGCGDRVQGFVGSTSFGAASAECPKPPPPFAVFAPTEGQSSVSGRAKKAASVEAHLMGGAETLAVETADVDSKSGKFTVTFDRKLVAGQSVDVYAVGANGSSPAATANVAPVDWDWGLVRAYFTGGMILSRDTRSFSKQDPFLGFNLDKSWVRPRKDYGWLRLNTFFDTRLAAVAVNTSPPGGKSGDNTAGTGSSGAGSSNAGQTTPTPTGLDKWLSSEKAAVMQVGVYTPMIVRQRLIGGMQNALFLAPLAKVGFSSLTGDSTSFNDKKFFPFRGYGVRLGHYHEFMERDDQGMLVYSAHAPELISYLDIVMGPYSNFPSVNPATHDVRRLRRASFEGVLKIPYTPFIVGFNANVALGTKKGYVNSDGDLRFLFGTRFDVGRLFAKLTAF